MELISLLVLCATLIIAFAFKLNSGLVAIAVSLIFALITGIPEKFLISSFNNSLFLMLLGVMYLFSIAQENKTLELLSKKIFDLCKGNAKALPVVIFLVGAVISALGPGLISVTALVSVLIVALAKEMDTPAIRLIPFGLLGAFAGGLSPITPTGIVAINISGENGITGVGGPVAWKMALTCCIYAVFLYFFVFKWHKQKKSSISVNEGAAPTPAFSLMQIMTLVGILVVAVVSSVFKVNVGLISFVVAVVLTLFKAADEGVALKKVPWSTLVMITGVGILISLVTELGGIDLLSAALSKLSTTKTAAMIMSLLSGVMSWVSSASGVVMPTLIPTVPDMVQSVQGANAVELVNSISIGANMAAMSPLSSCGALMLAAYSSSDNVSLKDRNKLFLQLFALSAGGVALTGLCALIGLY
ncbi:MAG: hypothetical protein J6A74_02675 [Oscillospiraceae bacterium]|nr:hypothetical protein [Oscillospiraceae bacterium]